MQAIVSNTKLCIPRDLPNHCTLKSLFSRYHISKASVNYISVVNENLYNNNLLKNNLENTQLKTMVFIWVRVGCSIQKTQTNYNRTKIEKVL